MTTIETIRRGGRLVALVQGESVLREHLTHGSAFTQAGPGGRGGIEYIELGHDRRAVRRHLRHGGLFGNLLGDLFAGTSRTLREFLTLLKARERGAPVVRPLAAITERIFGIFYRADLFTEEVPSRTLRQELESGAPEDLKPLLRALVDLHRGGVDHPDLQLDNILIPKDGSPWMVVDLDGARLHDVLPPSARLRSLLRLDRSYEKRFGQQGPVGFLRRYRFLHHYMKVTGLKSSDWLDEFRAEKLRRAWHRLGWQGKS
ncbi:MAG: lipopolysaccharide kinase InaA family protein [Planctomycetota bacterium]